MTDPAVAFTTRLVAALADLGLRHAVVSPGSRNTPLTLAFAIEPRVATHVVHDERSAAFLALGIAEASGVPPALLCTSGTAAAHYLPALVEARHGRVPLLAVTADRPPELRGTGAPQTIDQVGLYGAAVKRSLDVGVPDTILAARAPALALQAWAPAVDDPAGPVHLDLPFREPFPIPERPAAATGVAHVPAPATLAPEDLADLGRRLGGRRVLLVAGGRQRPGFGAAAAMLAGEAAFPVLADPQCRFPSPVTIPHADLLVSAGLLDRLTPDLVLRVGPIPTAKAVWRWLETHAGPQLLLDDGDRADPLGTASVWYRADPATTLAGLAGRVEPAPADWLRAWQEASATAGDAIAAVLADEPFPNEPMAARTVWRATPPEAILYVGSSLPIRHVDAFTAAGTGGAAELLAHRGANGIDGLLSAAAGAALTGRPVVVLAGDLSVLHDATALGILAREALPVTVVVLDNDGGGIFHLLPQATALPPEVFERFFATPHGLDLVAIAAAYGVPARRVTSAAELRDAVAHPGPGPRLLVVRTQRERTATLLRRIRQRVAAALV